MIPARDLRAIARARLRDAEVLLRARRYDSGVYLCGYAVELALKARICRTLGWRGFPESRGEFHDYVSFKTHDLPVLLHLSGKEERVRANHNLEWSAVAAWDPEARYKVIGSASEPELQRMIESSRVLLKAL